MQQTLGGMVEHILALTFAELLVYTFAKPKWHIELL